MVEAAGLVFALDFSFFSLLAPCLRACESVCVCVFLLVDDVPGPAPHFNLDFESLRWVVIIHCRAIGCLIVLR